MSSFRPLRSWECVVRNVFPPVRRSQQLSGAIRALSLFDQVESIRDAGNAGLL